MAGEGREGEGIGEGKREGRGRLPPALWGWTPLSALDPSGATYSALLDSWIKGDLYFADDGWEGREMGVEGRESRKRERGKGENGRSEEGRDRNMFYCTKWQLAPVISALLFV